MTVSAELGGCGFATNETLTVSGYGIGQQMAALVGA